MAKSSDLKKLAREHSGIKTVHVPGDSIKQTKQRGRDTGKTTQAKAPKIRKPRHKKTAAL